MSAPRRESGDGWRKRRMAGFTLLEVVLAMPLGLLVVMAATAIYLAGIRLCECRLNDTTSTSGPSLR